MTLKRKHFYDLLFVVLVGFLAWKLISNRPQKDIDISELQIVDTSGSVIELEELKGKPIFLNFWASWCGPCVREMPSIKKAQEAYSAKGIEFLIVNTEDQRALEIFENKKKFDLNYYVLKSSGNIDIKTIPLTYLINKDGEVTKVVNRSKNWASSTSYEQLNKLLK